MTSPSYNSLLAKGQGMVSETLALLRIWEPGMTAVNLRNKVIAEGLMPKATAYRASDVVNRVFAPRYLREGGEPAARLKKLLNLGLSVDKLTQLFLVYTTREHVVLHDFIGEVFWRKYNAGAKTLKRQEALEFLHSARAMGRISESWSDSVNIRVARYLLCCLSDFKYTRNLGRGEREILPFTVLTSTMVYLAYDIHFRGVNDNSILEHPDWSLFGLDRTAVVRELQRAGEGHFIVQHSGDLLRISWKHKTMEDCLDGIAE